MLFDTGNGLVGHHDIMYMVIACVMQERTDRLLKEALVQRFSAANARYVLVYGTCCCVGVRYVLMLIR